MTVSAVRRLSVRDSGFIVVRLNLHTEMSKQDTETQHLDVLEDGVSGACAKKRELTERLSCSHLAGVSDESASCMNNVLNASSINALRNSITRHNNNIVRMLLTSKETVEKRQQIESALRACKEAFFDLSSACLFMLENNASLSASSLNEVKDTITDALSEFRSTLPPAALSAREVAGCDFPGALRSYASVAGSCAERVNVAQGPSLEVTKTTNLLIVPRDDKVNTFGTSKDTREALIKAIKSSDFDLRVKRISSARNNGIRIGSLR